MKLIIYLFQPILPLFEKLLMFTGYNAANVKGNLLEKKSKHPHTHIIYASTKRWRSLETRTE